MSCQVAQGVPQGIPQQGVLTLQTEPRPWHVVRTRSRQEKALAEYLSARGVEHYLPMVRKVRYYGRRKQIAKLPLFPGYLFLRGARDEAFIADRTERVVQIIPVADQSGLEGELAAIRFALDRNGGLEPAPYLAAGVWVEVTAGPFRGLRGLIDRTVQDDRLILRVRMLGRAAEMEIDRTLLSPVG